MKIIMNKCRLQKCFLRRGMHSKDINKSNKIKLNYVHISCQIRINYQHPSRSDSNIAYVRLSMAFFHWSALWKNTVSHCGSWCIMMWIIEVHTYNINLYDQVRNQEWSHCCVKQISVGKCWSPTKALLFQYNFFCRLIIITINITCQILRA